MNISLLIIIAIWVSLAMASACAIQRYKGQSGGIDTIWSAAVGIGAWAIRLGGHISVRTGGGGEDPRYARLIEEWGTGASSKLFMFLQIQALVAFILVLAVYLAAANNVAFPRTIDGLAIAVALVALGGEAVADAQRARFRKTPQAKTSVCEVGLWRYSSHPNCFLEWLLWCCWPLLALAAPIWSWLAFLAALLMYWLLVHVSGISPLEEHMLRSRGEQFRALKRHVNAYFPGPPQIRPQKSRISAMNMLAFAINTAERAPLTDGMTLAGIDFLCGRTKRRLAETTADAERQFVETMGSFPVATHTDEANRQHYEMPADFFALALGPQRKYSCCLYPTTDMTLGEAETAALAETVQHAAITDGMTILELGCGWGSLSLYLARNFPSSRIVSVSNSTSQRAYILDIAQKDGLMNLDVITADMNDFTTGDRFDRVVSVEMFEHMSNWRTLLERVRGWVKPDGRLFLHVFTHKDRSYRFDQDDPADWIAHHFFTGGIMPAHDLPHRFGDLFQVELEWRWSGTHYRRTALDWLANFDREIDRIQPILTAVYGKDASLWQRRWRLFFLATAGLFGHENGNVWGVGHYLLAPTA